MPLRDALKSKLSCDNMCTVKPFKLALSKFHAYCPIGAVVSILILMNIQRSTADEYAWSTGIFLDTLFEVKVIDLYTVIMILKG